jgi:hypothetical protein
VSFLFRLPLPATDESPLQLPFAYPPVADAPEGTSAEQRHAPPGQPDATVLLEAQIASLKDVAALMREQLEDVQNDRDAWRSQAERSHELRSVGFGSRTSGCVLIRTRAI